MGKRFDALLFPGRKHKAFTLSYDDGVVQDRRLIELLAPSLITAAHRSMYPR